jgi:hypothetical protein
MRMALREEAGGGGDDAEASSASDDALDALRVFCCVSSLSLLLLVVEDAGADADVAAFIPALLYGRVRLTAPRGREVDTHAAAC